MDYSIVTDSSSNLTPDLAEQYSIEVVPLTLEIDGEEHAAYGEEFDGHAFYDRMRAHAGVRTSMVNEYGFLQAFEPIVAGGRDMIYIAMSSGISGTVQAAQHAAAALMEKYRGRRILVRDTLAASFGEGMFALEASRMRALGRSLDQVGQWVDDHVQRMNQLFTVDDLNYLRRGGRISRISAVIGTLGNIKPILFGDTQGRISLRERIIGRKASLKAIARRYFDQVQGNEGQPIAIAHGDCEEDANYLIDLIHKRFPKLQVLLRCYEPGTGAHVGPGAVALFFFGQPRRD
ncbi:MAG: DegV family protein [Clostridiales bacterium]|nr:DegV family protein [Clostridiales bacterium]